MGDRIIFKDKLIAIDVSRFGVLFRECTPRLLVVTDGLSFSSTAGFGLTQFVNTLRATTIHGMSPIVVTASRKNDPNADLKNFQLDDSAQGVAKTRYDVVFLLGFDPEYLSPLQPGELNAIGQFMQDGGGVFATGDHETLGASLSGDVPRVRSMRRWKAASAPPHVRGADRFSTNLSGIDETEEFADQSDTNPQRLYLNFRTTAGGLGQAHPLMQMKPPRRVLEVFPDHPHEGECLVPANLSSTFVLNGARTVEWPADGLGVTVSPEAVASSVSHGDGFPSGGRKAPLSPKLFAAIVAYDGHRANVGRVTTDATWHHFVNINIDGSGEPGTTGLQSPPGTDTEALIRIRQYYVNLATWLMPKTVRRCLSIAIAVQELTRFPLFEELELDPVAESSAESLRRIGEDFVASLSRRVPRWEAQAFLEDALEDALGEEQAQRLLVGEKSALWRTEEVAQTALGGWVTALAGVLSQLKDATEIKPHGMFERPVATGARTAVQIALKDRREEISRVADLLGELERCSRTRS